MNKVLRTLIFFFYTFSLHTTHAQQWKAYSSFSQANCFFAAQDSTLWIGTSGGILHYGKDYKLLASYNQNNGLDSVITSITKDVQGNIWACYYNQFSSKDSKTFIFDGSVWINNQSLGKAIITDKPLLFYAKDGSLWISYDKASKFVQVGKDSVYTSYDWEKNGISYFNNKSLLVDSKEHFWVSIGTSFWFFDGNKWTKYDNSNSSLPKSYIYNNAVIDQDDNICFTNYEAIYKFNISTKTCTFIPLQFAEFLYLTKENKVLISGGSGIYTGLYQLNGDKLSVLVPNVYPANIYEDFRGNLLLGGYDKLRLFDGSNLKDFPLPKNSLSSNIIAKIVSDTKNNILIQPLNAEIQYLKNTGEEVIDITDYGYTIAQGEGDDLWVSQFSSLTQIKQDNGLKLINHPLDIQNSVEKIVKDKNQHIWAWDYQYSWSTNRYQYLLFYYDKSKWTTFNLENEIIDMAANPNGGIYILNTKGVFTHDGISLKATNYLNIPKNPKRFVSNANLDLYIIAKKNENFEGDIYQLVGNKFDKIVTPDEFRIMTSYYFSDFMIDSKGNFWSVGNKIQRYDGKTLTTFNSPFRSTNPDYFSTITNAIHESKDGKVWLGSYTGLSSLIVDCKNPLPTSLRTEKMDGFGTGQTQLSVNESSANSFAWQISKDKGATWRAITNFDSTYSGHRTNQLTVNQVKIRDNNIIYRCLVNGECNSVLSDTVSIQAKQCELPQTTLQPTAQTTTEKSSAQFFINVSGASAYQWQVSTDKGVTWNMISSSDTLYRGQETNTLNIVSANLSQNTYQYRCEIKNDCYTLYSNAAPLEVTMILGLDNFERTVQAYPNPANDKIYVKVPAQTYTLSLINSNGSTVKQVSNQDYINVKDIPNGFYILLIESGKERQSIKVQVVK
ncbi:T9SS type A sorting domain-containing protein [Arcicella sp. DC2W]|uniref:T9SS type A sorting domain-containing protein n=1 Tax=Arcicella gelida TaxID=2984195 RepID=A0ABU5S7H9_9BACT|nr:T9SS type A sorting domain-containing protein [Arcicella sp. DC2W]MEA5404364.1 T9SS type A sorting domain-containing protein [Arcicella sp. DC2W]